MPPFFVEKNIGIQKFKHDPSLSDDEIAMVARWVDAGAPRGNPADMPKPLEFDGTDKWTIGEPDLLLRSKDVTVPAIGPDKWGDFGLVPTGLTEDRYVSAVEVREVNDIPHDKSVATVGDASSSPMTYESIVEGERASSRQRGGSSWPIRRGRPQRGHLSAEVRLLAAHSSLALSAGHLHSNGRETKGHLEFAFKFFPKGYKPTYKRSPCVSATASTSTCGPTNRARSSTPTPCSRSTPNTSPSSRTCMRPACACASRRSGASTSRPSIASATTTTG
jgi:hypothetical protein